MPQPVHNEAAPAAPDAQAAYEAAILALLARRDRVWSSAPDTDICGCPCLPLTLRAYIDLSLASNAVVWLNRPTPDTVPDAHVVAFLWRLHPLWPQRDTPAGKRACSAQTKRLAQLLADGIAPIKQEAIDMVRHAFEDSTLVIKRDDKSSPPPAASFADYIIDELATAYGWTPHVILDLPLSAVHQLQRAIKQRLDPNASFPLPCSAERKAASAAKRTQSHA